MKALSVSLLIMLTGLSCQTARVGPTDLLYRTWQRTTGTYKNQPSPYESLYEKMVVEFRPDGQLLYGNDKQPGECCLNKRFEAVGAGLRFGNLDACPTVRCAPPEFTRSVIWQLETLTATELIIRTDEQRIVFSAQ